MPLLADRVRETTTTTGTGTLALGGAVTGYQSFNTAFANGAQVYYVIQFGAEWELGIGTVGPGTLSRDTVLESSNLDAFVPFSVGLKDVFVSYLASRAVTTSDAATLTNKTIDDYTNNVGANSTHFRIKATGTIAKGAVVKATGYNPGEAAIEVAVVSSATDLALGICEQPLTAGQFGLAVVIGELFDVNTNGLTVNGILYSNGSGGFTQTKPSSGTYQPLGWVVRANTNNGVIAVNIVAPLYVEASTNTANTLVLRDGSGNFSAGTVTAALAGNATTATTADKVANALTAGTYLTSGGTFDGAAARTFAVDATSANTASKVVARDASGDFSAGTITANLTGNISGTAPAGTLTGTTLASNVVSSSLTSVGTLSSLTVSGNTIVGAEVYRSSATSYMRLDGGSGSGSGANFLAFGETHATNPGRISIAAVGAGAIQMNTGGALRASIDNTGNLAVDTNTLYVDAANNRVGVGTTGPSYEMDIRVAASNGLRVGSNANSFGTLLSWDNPSGQARLWSLGAYSLILGTNGTGRAELDASGNLGLGVTPSAWNTYRALDVIGGGGFISANNAAEIWSNAFFDGAVKYKANGFATRYHANSSGAHAWYTAPNNSLGAGVACTFVQAMTLDASGNLGVGTTGPLNRLSVGVAASATLGSNDDGIRISNATTRLQLSVTGSSYSYAGVAASSALVYSVSQLAMVADVNNPITFHTGSAPSERARIDSSGNLGIGTVSPATKLDVRGSAVGGNVSAIQIDNTAAGSGSPPNTVSLNFANAGSAKASITAGVYGDGYMDFATNDNTVKMRLTASGNLGLGVTPSAWAIPSIQFQGQFAIGPFGYTRNGYYDTGWKYVAAGQATAYQQASGIHSWYTAPSGTAGNAITFTQAATLDASSNFSAGTTSIASAGQTNGITAGSVLATKGVLNAHTTSTGVFEYNSNVTRIRSYGATAGTGSIAFNVGGGGGSPDSQAMTLDANSNLTVSSAGSQFVRMESSSGSSYRGFGIGATGDSVNYGLFQMRTDTGEVQIKAGATGWGGFLTVHTNGTERARITSGGTFIVGATSAPAAAPKFYVESNAVPAIYGKNTGAGGYTFNSDAASNGGTYYHFNFLDAGTSHGSISSNGTNTAYNTSSDVRLKTNIADADAAGAVIDAIVIRQFDWKSNNRHQRYGVIAQEVEPVFPEMVTKGQTDDDMWGVDYSTLVPMLVKEIQSLRGRVAALEA